MKKTITLFLLMALFAMMASAQTTFNDGTFKYELTTLSATGETVAKITSWYAMPTGSNATVNVPGYVNYNGTRYRVDEIGIMGLAANDNAPNTNIRSIVVGYGVQRINNYAFRSLSNLYMVQLPSSVNYLGYDLFYNNSVLTYVLYAGEDVPTISSGTFSSGASSKICSTSTNRAALELNSNSLWKAAFSAIARHRGYMVGDFKVYNSTNKCWQYYIIKNGIPYNGNSSNPAVRSLCVLVGASFTDGSNYTISLPQSVGDTDNNAPGNYKFYGVADEAFKNNTSITKITNNNTMAHKIGDNAFFNCSNLTSADVPVDTIGNNAFDQCTKLSSVTITSNLNSTSYIGNFAFGHCAFTGTVDIPATVKYIGTAPFYFCTSLTKIYVDGNNPNYSSFWDALYDKAQTKLIQIPVDWSSKNRSNGWNEVFPETLQRVFQYAAAGCVLEQLYLTYGVKQIDQYAFYNCKNLKTVHLPSSVTTVPSTAFAGCTAINRVELNYMTPPATDFFPAVTNKSNVKLYTPREAYTAYANSSIWSQYNRQTGTYDHLNCWDINYFDDHICYSVTPTPYEYNDRLRDGTLKIVRVWTNLSYYNDRAYIRDVVYYADKSYVPTSIGAYAGYHVEEPFSISGKTGCITDIEENAFRDSKLKYFTFPKVEHIGDYAFYNATSLNDNLIPTNLKTVGVFAFAGTKIGSFTPSSPLTSVGQYAFYNCSNLHEVSLPQSSQNSLTCGKNFFGNNADDFKCYVDYRWLGDFLNTNKWDVTKIYPHLKMDSEYQSFACIKPINFGNSSATVYYVAEYDPSEKKAYLVKPNDFKLAANNGVIVSGNVGQYYRLDYADSGTTTDWMVAVTSSPQTVNSNSTTSYFKVNPNELVFDKITGNTIFDLGSAYLTIPTDQTGGATTIVTNFGGSTVVDIPGDVNGDGHVNVSDVSALINMILGITPMDQTTGDVNGDDRVNVSDVSALINIILGIQ